MTGSTGRPAGAPPPEPLTIEQVKAMTPEQINARWAEVSKVLATQVASVKAGRS